MTTLAQSGLAQDASILRTVVHANDGFAGLNMQIVQTGLVRVGDEVRCVDG